MNLIFCKFKEAEKTWKLKKHAFNFLHAWKNSKNMDFTCCKLKIAVILEATFFSWMLQKNLDLRKWFETFLLWDGDKNVSCYLKSTHGAQEKLIIQSSILNETPYFPPRIFFTIQSRPKTVPCHSCTRMLGLWILLQQKKFNPLEPNYDCMRFLPLLGDILNSLGIFYTLFSPDESNLLPPVSRKQFKFLKNCICFFQLFSARSIQTFLKKLFTNFVSWWKPTKIQLKIFR